MAAGSSSRMGTPKQLLSWNNSTLIESAIKTALQVQKTKVYVVLGAHFELIAQHIKTYPINIVENPDWEKGLGSSIAAGVKAIDQHHDLEGVMIVLADQPLVSSTDVLHLIKHFESGKNRIVATAYNEDNIGVPAIFDHSYFDALAKLNEDRGAKSILKEYSEQVCTVSLPNKLLDIDTPEGYEQLLKINHQS